jgi:ribosome-associated toxin RatA of RatAB toxin-antitoxin module
MTTRPFRHSIVLTGIVTPSLPTREHTAISNDGTAAGRGRDTHLPAHDLDLAHAAPLWSRDVSDYSQSYTTTVAGSVEDCFAVLTDFAAYPQWSSPITECRIVERYPDGLARRVSFALDMTLKTVRYTLDYTYDPPRGARWHLVEGDVRGVEGSYTFEPAGSATAATCMQTVDLGFWIPGPIKRVFEAKALRDSVEEFRKAVELRAGRGGR